MSLFRTLFAAGLALCAATPLSALSARVWTADPSNLKSVLADAQPGDQVKLEGGDYGDVTLPQRQNSSAIHIYAKEAKLSSLMIRKTQGWRWIGGTVIGDPPPKQYHAITIDASRQIEVIHATVSGSKVGINVTRGSQDIVLRANKLTKLVSDGINVVSSQRVLLKNNRCYDFDPIMPVYSATGELLQDGSHADCIQLWTAKDLPITSDVTIVGNLARGYMQGIGQYKSWGPIRNILVHNNDIAIDFWNGIAFSNAEGLDVRENNVRSTLGARALKYPYQPIKTKIYAAGSRLYACDNYVPDIRNGFGTARCGAGG